MTPSQLQADQNSVCRACVGSWTRESAIMTATGLGRGRVRRALELLELARRIKSSTVWLAHNNYPVRAWRAIGNE
jgi:hypothetical protein